MKLIEIIEENIAFQFTGRINIIKKENSQLLGFILIKDGNIIHAKHGNFYSKKALVSIFILEKNTNDLKYIIEPEIIDKNEFWLNLDWTNLKKELLVYFQNFNGPSKNPLRPPNNINLKVNPKFIMKGDNVSTQEFLLMLTIIKYPCPKDIFEHSEFLEGEVTQTMVSLRKKGVLKVILDSPHSP
jgi:hypothetical protein